MEYESLSRPFHSRKLSNATTITSFSGKNAYDGVFSGHHRHKYTGGSPIDVQDYREIFGSSSSVPVLDLSTLVQENETFEYSNMKFRSLKPDYATIFGGFHDEDIAVSYEELFTHDKPRTTTSTKPTSPDSDNLSHRSSDDLKQFNMSYNKISPNHKDGSDGKIHVTQLHDTPGFTCFIDESVPPPKMETKNQISSDVDVRVDSSKKEEKKLFSEDKSSKTFDIHFKIFDQESVPTATNSESCKMESSENAPGGGFSATTYFDEEVDVSSTASASAAALKKAIEKAQESIRIAKESVGRKNKGLRSFSSKKSKDKLKVESTTDDCKYGGFSDSMDGEKLFVAKKVIDEIHGKIAESTKECSISLQSSNEFKDSDNIVSDYTQVTGETESIPLHSAEKDEYSTFSFEAEKSDEKLQEFDEKIEVNMCRESEEDKVEVSVSEKVEDEKKVSEESIQNDNEKQGEVVEDEEEDVDDAEMHTKISDGEDSDGEDSDEGVEEASSEGVESENKSKNDEIFKEEETSEMFLNVCEVEITKESVQTCDNIVEESEATMENDREINEANDEYSSDDANVMEETDIQETEASGEFHGTQAMKETESLEEEEDFLEKTSVDQTASDENDDECEVKRENLEDLEQNESQGTDIQSESSSHGAQEIEADQSNKENIFMDQEKIVTSEEEEEEESNIQPPHKEETEAPREPQVLNQSKAMDEEAVKERERLAVERAIREARERARERVERAAVEKATEEVRQRMMASAREKSKLKSDKISAQNKLKAERAAVERATSEARQRALEKAMSHKSSSSSDSHGSNATISESALRTKARLEKHNRIMERAAKALAEKEKRDLLAQKEQAERNRLAENLDADIKRWASGKEGNLRALLSTLQYILGPESGWKAVTLTEIIATSAVKKAYRKATLCVHPDKLQQRGASIQQKYICEKVFDLLKAAWNRFDSGER